MRDAYVSLASAKERMGRAEILHKYQKLMAEKFVRTEPLGMDRHGRRYWVFEGDSRCVRSFALARCLFRSVLRSTFLSFQYVLTGDNQADYTTWFRR